MSLARAFCFAVGPALLLNGILGLAFGGREFAVGDDLPRHEFNLFFEFNGWHHVLHIGTAALLCLGAVRAALAPAMAVAFGAVYLVLTPLGFIDGDDVANMVYSPLADNFIHLTLAVVGTAVGVRDLVLGRAEDDALRERPAA